MTSQDPADALGDTALRAPRQHRSFHAARGRLPALQAPHRTLDVHLHAIYTLAFGTFQ